MKHLLNRIKQLPIDELFFYFFIFTVPFQLRTIINSPDAYIDYYFSYHLAIFFYLSDLIFLAFLSAYLLFNNQEKRKLWPVIIPILWAVVNVFHVEQWDLWLFNVLKTAQFWLIISYFALKPRIFKNVIYVLIVLGIFQALLGIVQFHVQHSIGFSILGEYMPNVLDSGASTINTLEGKLIRPYGTFAHPNILGGFLTICLTLWLYVSRGTSTYRSWTIVSCGTFVLTTGLIATMSRTAWLAAGLSAAYLILYTAWKKSLKKAIIIASILIVSCGTSMFTFKSAFLSRFQPAPATPSAIDYRYDFNSFAFEAISNFKLEGLGVGQYVPWLNQTHALLPWQYQPPHNIALFLMAEIGIIGLLLSILTYILIGFTWNNLSVLNIMLGIAILIIGMLDHYLITIQSGLLLLSILGGLAIANKKDVSLPVKHLSTKVTSSGSDLIGD